MDNEIYLSRAQTEQEFYHFVRFPRKIYKDAPELAASAVNERRAFLEREKSRSGSEFDVQCFLAYKGREPAGTIATIINRNYNVKHSTQTGFLAFFDSIENKMVSLALFDIAHYWLKKEGMETLRGGIKYVYEQAFPKTASTTPPSSTSFTPSAPDYYVDFIARYGFKEVSEEFEQAPSQQKVPGNFSAGENKIWKTTLDYSTFFKETSTPDATARHAEYQMISRVLAENLDKEPGKSTVFPPEPDGLRAHSRFCRFPNNKAFYSYEYKMV